MGFSESRLTARLVLLVIAHHVSTGNGEAWPSISTIAREARCSKSSVRSAIKGLTLTGELGIASGALGRGKSRHYRLPKFNECSQNLDPLAGKGANPGHERSRSCEKKVQTLDKNRSRTISEAAAPAVTAASTSEAWRAIGLDSTVRDKDFQQFWETFYAARNGQALSVVMGMCADAWETRGRKVAGPFFKALALSRAQDKRSSELQPDAANSQLNSLADIIPEDR
jgi:hypothetical protein